MLSALRYVVVFLFALSAAFCESLKDRPKVYDCFTFYNELDRLHIRLAELYDVVDKFVLIEATSTHQGSPKPLFYESHKEDYTKYADKIEHVVVDLPKKGSDHWVREGFQRNQLIRVLKKLGACDEDIVFVSDADEITRAQLFPSIIELLASAPMAYLSHRLYIYYLNSYAPSFDHTSWAFVAKWGFLKTRVPTAVRFAPINKRKHCVIPDAGWHFSWVGSALTMAQKMQGVVEGSKANRDGLATQANMADWKKSMKFGSSQLEVRVLKLDDSFPQYVRDNRLYFEEKGFLAPVDQDVEN